MKKQLTYLLLFVFAALSSWACNKKTSTADTPAIKKVNIYVRYLEETRNIYAEAIFYGDSGTVQIPDGVRFQEQNMRLTNIPKIGWRYQTDITKKMNAPDTVWFQFKTPDGTDTRHFVLIPKLTDLAIPSGGFTKKTGGEVTWSNKPCGDEETLICRLTDTTGTSYNINHIGRTRGSELEILPPQIKDVVVGHAHLALTRKQNLITNPDKGTKILSVAEYYTKEMPTMISE